MWSESWGGCVFYIVVLNRWVCLCARGVLSVCISWAVWLCCASCVSWCRCVMERYMVWCILDDYVVYICGGSVWCVCMLCKQGICGLYVVHVLFVFFVTGYVRCSFGWTMCAVFDVSMVMHGVYVFVWVCCDFLCDLCVVCLREMHGVCGVLSCMYGVCVVYAWNAVQWAKCCVFLVFMWLVLLCDLLCAVMWPGCDVSTHMLMWPTHKHFFYQASSDTSIFHISNFPILKPNYENPCDAT